MDKLQKTLPNIIKQALCDEDETTRSMVLVLLNVMEIMISNVACYDRIVFMEFEYIFQRMDYKIMCFT